MIVTDKMGNLKNNLKQKNYASFYTDEEEDIYDYLSGLFSAEDFLINNAQIKPAVRIALLNKLTHNVLIKAALKKEKTVNVLDIITKSYLNKVLKDLLNNELLINQEEIGLKELFKTYILKQFGFTDSTGQPSANHEEQFNYSFYNESNTAKKRNLIISELFNGDYKKYLSVYNEKLIISSVEIFKTLVYRELQKFQTKALEEAILFLSQNNYGISFVRKDEPVYFLVKNPGFMNLMANGQKEFYEAMQLIKNKKELHEDDKYLMDLWEWFKHQPEACKNILNNLPVLTGIKMPYLNNKPNTLIIYISSVLGNLYQALTISKPVLLSICPDEIINSLKNTSEKISFDRIKTQAINLSWQILKEETDVIHKAKREIRIKKLNIFKNHLVKIFFILFFIAGTVWGYKNYIDIDSIYKNKFLKSANLNLELTPYPGVLYDSLIPSQNELYQKQRLDYIKDLNLRYFKVFTLYLNPDISGSILETTVKSIPIPQDLQNIDSLKESRKTLSDLISAKEWKINYEPLFGKNILSELRAYGIICNFLLPPITHYIIKDSSGQPLIKNGEIKIFSPPDEKTLLKKDLIRRFGQIPEDKAFEPKVYLENYDEDYKNMKALVQILLEKIKQKNDAIITAYKHAKDKHQKENLKSTLKTTALIEAGINDLLQKIKERHDFIARHNTYRALLK